MSQMPWRFINESGFDQLEVDGVQYERSYGNPGKSPEGEGLNNCLIDSLRQCLDIVLSPEEAVALGKAVRRDLEAEFDEPLDDQRRLVTRASYLDIGHHWQAILRSLLRHNTSNSSAAFVPNDYCIVGLFGNRPGHGVVFGRRDAPNRLVVINWYDMHFDACIRQ